MTMRMIRPGRAPAPGTRLAVGAVALLAVLGVAGGFPPAAQAGSAPGPAWTRQATVTHPPGEAGTMAYDAATGTAVLLGGTTLGPPAHMTFHDTWIWG